MAGQRRYLLLVALLLVALVAAACEADDDPADDDAADDDVDTGVDDEDPPDDEDDPELDDEDDELDDDDDEVDDDVDEEDDEAEADDGEMVSITVGDVAGTPSAFLEFTVQEGFLEDEGLDVEVEASPGGAANVPGVEAGDFQIAGSNVVSMLLARGQGLELQMVSAGTFATEDEEDDFSQVLVTEDSDIESAEDLDGRSVAVNTLANIAEVTIRAAMDNEGADHENVDFVEMGFPDMVPALEDGQVDAVHVIEPFMSIGLDAGHRPVLTPYAGTEPGMGIGSYFSSDEYIEENPDVIDSFIAGVTAGGDYIEENPDEFREALVDLADLEPEVAENVNLPTWGGPVDEGTVELIGGYMEEYGLYDETPPLDEVIYQP